nr:cytochrome b [Peltigera rufescens]
MRIFKSHPLLKLVNSYVIDSPQPSNLSYLWNFGSLLSFCLIIQIVTGVTLAMHYSPTISEAFNSVEHIMRDVNNGWLIRYLHSNTASAFFFLVYLHIGRGLYYGSYRAPRTLVMLSKFVCITLWPNVFMRCNSYNMHLIVLHDRAGSGNPLGVSGNYDRLPFAPYFIFKDLITIFIFILGLSVFVFFMPNILGDSENYVMANPMQTPPAIVPELLLIILFLFKYIIALHFCMLIFFDLLPFYAILRSIPNKLLGVIAMFSAIVILLAMPFTDLSRSRGIQFRPLSKAAFFIFVGNFLILMQLGAKHVESPFIEFGQISTVLYFSHFLIIVPLISLLENSLIELASKKNTNTNTNTNTQIYQTSAKSAQDLNKLLKEDINIKLDLTFSLVLFLFIVYCLTNWNDIHLFSTLLYCDAPRPWGLYFQDSATPQMEGLVELHDNIMFYLSIILFSVGWILISIIIKFNNKKWPIANKYLSHGTLIELIWTITPALILILIAFPSFKLLYLMDEVSDPAMVVLAEGHQWYWSYQYPDFLNSDDEFIEFDSYLIPESDLEEGTLRMLEVDNRVIIPELTHVSFMVTGADVIHSYACPSLGIKCDAYPGRLNQVSVFINREGTFYGQCSEICGILHSSMPIVIESVSIEKFITWLQEQ